VISSLSLTNASLICVLTWCLCGCSRQLEPAEQALNDIQRAMTGASPDATKYIPVEFANLSVDQEELSFSFDRRDYAAVIAGAPAVLARAKRLTADAAAKKAEATKTLTIEWNTLEHSMPPLIAAVRTRIKAIPESKVRARGVHLETARSDIARATALWDKGEAVYQAGDIEDAVADVNAAKPIAEAAASALGLGTK
jgi:hypothetical protein